MARKAMLDAEPIFELITTIEAVPTFLDRLHEYVGTTGVESAERRLLCETIDMMRERLWNRYQVAVDFLGQHSFESEDPGGRA